VSQHNTYKDNDIIFTYVADGHKNTNNAHHRKTVTERLNQEL